MKRLMRDDSGHWYVIDANDSELFKELLYREEDEQKFNDKFGDCMLNCHISAYVFDNFREG